MKSVKFWIGEETTPVIEGVDRYEDSIFQYQIIQGLSIISSILDREVSHVNDDAKNNIVAFVGERGAGKTSCMYSVLEFLKYATEKQLPAEIAHAVTPELKPRKFAILNSIDPSFFDTEHNILELLIGKLYGEMKRRQKVLKAAGNDDSLSIGQLLKAFQKTKDHLHYITQKRDSVIDNEIEELDYLASGVDLRTGMRDLINNYLHYMEKDTLVISIDDIDLNTAQAYNMVEQIRKYLIMPKVIVLIAVKLTQLSEVIQLKLTREFNETLGNSMTITDIAEMAERYLTKLIPLQSRVFIPTPDTFFDAELEIYNGKELLDSFSSVRLAVPELIFRKCRYLFYNTRGTTSLIVPRNLRDLRLLVRMLYDMPEYVKNSEETLGNKELFKKYFYGTWLDAMSMENRRVAQAILAENEPTLFNKTVIQQLVKLYVPDTTSLPKEYADIVDKNNFAFNVSLGDSLYFMEYLNNMNPDVETKKLLFFIKSVYSIRMYEYYDMLTDRLRSGNIVEETKPKEMYRGESLEKVSSYEKLIGGSFFKLGNNTLIAPQRMPGGDQDRELRLVSGKTLRELIKELTQTAPDYKDAKPFSLDLPAKYQKKLRLAEFFMLTVSRYVWTTDVTLQESPMHRYRVNSPAFYDRDLSEVDNLCFDVLAPFFTMLDIKHSYDRFDEEIFAIAHACNDSLLCRLQRDFDGHTERYLSKVGLRNCEVIEDLFQKMKLDRRKSRQNSGSTINIEILKRFYSLLSDYEIASYDYVKEGESREPYQIKMDHYKILSDVLESVDVRLFDKIFDPRSAEGKIDSELLKRYFKDFLGSHKTMNQNSIVRELKKYNSQFLDRVGEDIIRMEFAAKISFSQQRIVNGLERICQKTNFELDNVR